MPVRLPVAESSDRSKSGLIDRMSASQANTYEACPRLWFYQKVVYRFKMPQIPVLFVGRAVEEAVCRVLRGVARLRGRHRRVAEASAALPHMARTVRRFRPAEAQLACQRP